MSLESYFKLLTKSVCRAKENHIELNERDPQSTENCFLRDSIFYAERLIVCQEKQEGKKNV